MLAETALDVCLLEARGEPLGTVVVGTPRVRELLFRVVKVAQTNIGKAQAILGLSDQLAVGGIEPQAFAEKVVGRLKVLDRPRCVAGCRGVADRARRRV